MDELRYIKPIQLFAEAEEKRLRDIMVNIREYDSPQMVRARYGMRKSELRTFPRIPQIASDGVEEYMKISDYKILVSFVKELIRQGLIICEIKDEQYNSKGFYIELSAVVAVPKIAQKRLDIDITE